MSIACTVSIHAPRAGRDDAQLVADVTPHNVSIHAPRAGRDSYRTRNVRRSDSVSIHAPRAGRDAARRRCGKNAMTFQSTRPARGATTADRYSRSHMLFQSTRPARGATTLQVSARLQLDVSIHAPRVGRDRRCAHRVYKSPSFNPRAPRGARLISLRT